MVQAHQREKAKVLAELEELQAEPEMEPDDELKGMTRQQLKAEKAKILAELEDLERGTAQPAQPMPQAMPGPPLMAVTCPAGAGAGSAVQIQAPGGTPFQVGVPVGVGPGQTFHVQVPTNPPPQAQVITFPA